MRGLKHIDTKELCKSTYKRAHVGKSKRLNFIQFKALEIQNFNIPSLLEEHDNKLHLNLKEIN